MVLDGNYTKTTDQFSPVKLYLEIEVEFSVSIWKIISIIVPKVIEGLLNIVFNILSILILYT